MDGCENIHKCHENRRRQEKAEDAREKNDARGQIRNTPDYINMAVAVCQFMGIRAHVSSYEADPQVAHHALQHDLIAVTSDSDLLAYGPSDQSAKGSKLRKIMIVSKYSTDSHRIIDLESDVEVGKLPLFDLYRKYGRIVFQLYAGISGCDFTFHHSGIPKLGISKFVRLMDELNAVPSTKNLAAIIW